MGVAGSKELVVHMARLPLVKRHDLKTKKGLTQTIEMKSGAQLVVAVPISKTGETKQITFKLASAKMKNEKEKATQTLKGSIPLTAQELDDALRLHTGKKPEAEVDPINLETSVLLGTLKDKQDEIKYKVKLTADIKAVITPVEPGIWSKTAGAAEVEAVVDASVIFDPIVSPELNPVKTDTKVVSDEKPAGPTMMEKMKGAASGAVGKASATMGAASGAVASGVASTRKKLTKEAPSDTDAAADAGQDAAPGFAPLGFAAEQPGDGQGSTAGEYCVTESASEASVSGDPSASKASSNSTLAKWAAAFRRKKDDVVGEHPEAMLPTLPGFQVPDGEEDGASGEENDSESSEELEVHVTEEEAGDLEPDDIEAAYRATVARAKGKMVSSSASNAASNAAYNAAERPSGGRGHVTEKEAGDLDPDEIEAAYKATLARAKGHKAPPSEPTAASKTKSWAAKTFGLGQPEPEQSEEEIQAAAEFREQRGHDYKELYVEKPAGEAQPVAEAESEPIDEAAAAAYAKELESKRKFGGSSKHQELYGLVKAEA